MLKEWVRNSLTVKCGICQKLLNFDRNINLIINMNERVQIEKKLSQLVIINFIWGILDCYIQYIGLKRINKLINKQLKKNEKIKFII